MNMKYLLTLPLILFSLFSHSEDELDKIFNDIESQYKKLSGKYYCISQKPFMYYSEFNNDIFKSDFYSKGNDTFNKPKGVLEVDYLNQSIFSRKFLGMGFSQCNIVGNDVLSCTDNERGRNISFNPNTNEYFLSEFFDGRVLVSGYKFINSEIGQCEKVD